MKKIIFFEKEFLMYNIVFSRNVFLEKIALKDKFDSFYLRKHFERSKKNICEKAVLYCKIEQPVSQ
jgi:hypothetical protein